MVYKRVCGAHDDIMMYNTRRHYCYYNYYYYYYYCYVWCNRTVYRFFFFLRKSVSLSKRTLTRPFYKTKTRNKDDGRLQVYYTGIVYTRVEYEAHLERFGVLARRSEPGQDPEE